MILAELIRRGRGDRILIVTPRHILEQTQHEMWSRFAIPFVRLDSRGIQRVRQKLPATRNPFSYFRRVIISIDTLKSTDYLAHLRKQHWDAVVIDESHNVTNSGTLNNTLANALAPRTEALILASATPHNGKTESFAELIRMLEPTAVRPDGTIIEDEVRRLIIRRHRGTPEVSRTVGSDWAERKPPQHLVIPASDEENAVAEELDKVWLHPESGKSPYSGPASGLFPWNLAKAFLSSPAALRESVDDRIGRIEKKPTAAQAQELQALTRLAELVGKPEEASSAKYDRLLAYLGEIGVNAQSPERVVIFAERVATLKWLRARLQTDLMMNDDQVIILHGGLADTDQQDIVESFKQESSPIRVLVTGDLASEGVNLHLQCHELVHYDIPWSLIRIEQRNGRIDRYGQRKQPQITTLLLNPSAERFSGDLRVLSRLIEKEQEAHQALGEAASLMGKYDGGAEEETIKQVLAGKVAESEAVQEVAAVTSGNGGSAILGRLVAHATQAPVPDRSPEAADASLYNTPAEFLRDALHAIYDGAPEASPAAGGVGWREHANQDIVELAPPPDLKQRLEVLPQSYLSERKVTQQFKLATSKSRGTAQLKEALADESDSAWPEAHYLGPLHPVIDWAADQALANLGRNQVFAVRGKVESPTVLLLGTLTNRRGQVVSSVYLSVEFPGFPVARVHKTAAEMTESIGYAKTSNPGPVADADGLRPLIERSLQPARAQMDQVSQAARNAITERVEKWSRRAVDWDEEAGALIQRTDLVDRRVSVSKVKEIATEMVPERQLVRPLLVIVPTDHPVAGAGEE